MFNALLDTRNVVTAVILRDIRSRFFNHGLGFIIVPLWPFVHMGVIIIIHSFAHGQPPYGESSAIFYMTGVIPFLAFSYTSRFMGYSLHSNKNMLAFPIVRVFDVVLGRAVLEMLSAFATLGLIVITILLLGENPFPTNIEVAVSAYLATLFLAFGCGFFVAVISLLAPIALTIYQLIIIVLYISSGIFFVPSNLPDALSYFLWFNPVLECIEWLRMGYYESYSDKLVSPTYVISFAALASFLALFIEYVFRRQVSEGP